MDTVDTVRETQPGSFIWNDHGRFIEVHPVVTGWLVVWGRYEDMGTIRRTEGNVVYTALNGVRGRLIDAVLELTRSPRTARDAATLFDFHAFPAHEARLPEPLW